jgi:hypothetical protein
MSDERPDAHECGLPDYMTTPLWTLYQCGWCNRRYQCQHGDGMMTPPRPYWKQLRRLHLRRYR